MARDDYHVIAAKILKYLYECLKEGKEVDAESISAKELGINQEYLDYIFKNLAESGYINGVVFGRTLGNTKTQVKIYYNRLEITPDGIAYLNENSIMKRAVGFLTDINDLIRIFKQS